MFGNFDIKDKLDNFELVEVCYWDSVLDYESERVLSVLDYFV